MQNIYLSLAQAVTSFDGKKTWFQLNFNPTFAAPNSLWIQEALNGIATAIGLATFLGGPGLVAVGILGIGIASGVNTYLGANPKPDNILDNIAAMEK